MCTCQPRRVRPIHVDPRPPPTSPTPTEHVWSKDQHPTGETPSCTALELNVRTELTLAETGPSQEEALSVPIDEWLIDPADAQRYEVGLRSLLGAVEALEDGSGPAGTSAGRGSADRVKTAGHLPNGPGPGTETEGW